MVQVIIQNRLVKRQTIPNWSSLEGDYEGQLLLQSEHGCCRLYITQTQTIIASQITKKTPIWQCRGKSQAEKQSNTYKNYSKHTISLQKRVFNYSIRIFSTGHLTHQK